MTVLASVNLFASDLDGLVGFYADLFGLPEYLEQRSPIFRALDAGGSAIGFNAHDAYGLLGLGAFATPTGIRSLLTFEVESRAAVAQLTDEAEARGATIIKRPYDTGYGSRQCVLLDPEGNAFRINAFAA